jgi:hypothetical protein
MTNQMNRSQLFQLTKDLTTELGHPTKELSSRWLQAGSNRKYWMKQIKKLQKNISLRERNLNRVLKISRINQERIIIPTILRGTDNKIWIRELRRLRMRARRNPSKAQRMTQTRSKVREALRQTITQRELNRTFDSLLLNKQFQQVFTLVASGATLTNTQADIFIANVMTDPRRFVVTITLDNGEIQKIPYCSN